MLGSTQRHILYASNYNLCAIEMSGRLMFSKRISVSKASDSFMIQFTPAHWLQLLTRPINSSRFYSAVSFASTKFIAHRFIAFAFPILNLLRVISRLANACKREFLMGVYLITSLIVVSKYSSTYISCLWQRSSSCLCINDAPPTEVMHCLFTQRRFHEPQAVLTISLQRP